MNYLRRVCDHYTIINAICRKNFRRLNQCHQPPNCTIDELTLVTINFMSVIFVTMQSCSIGPARIQFNCERSISLASIMIDTAWDSGKRIVSQQFSCTLYAIEFISAHARCVLQCMGVESVQDTSVKLLSAKE